MDENEDDYHNATTQLRQVVNTINTFGNAEECIDFINSIEETTAFFICSAALGQITMPAIHNKRQVGDVYPLGDNKAYDEQWPKVKDVFRDITPICEALKQAAQDRDHNAVSITFAQTPSGASSGGKDTLNCSFMYAQILKDILLTIEFDDGHIKESLHLFDWNHES